jgi:hypothetical protein
MGSRTTGNGAGSYMVAGPSWEGQTPPGIAKVFRSETDFSFALYRTQLFSPADIDNVKKVQAGYKAQTLSDFLRKPAPPPAPEVRWPRIDKKLARANPLAYVSFLLQFCPTAGPAAVEKSLRSRFRKIGIEAGKPFPADTLSADDKKEVQQGVIRGYLKIKERISTLGKDENGWRVGASFGDRTFYKGDWLLRAAAAMAALYGNDAEEALYPLLATDSDGDELDGGKHRYALTFPKGQLPPAKAFWSVTMYDEKTQLLIENPIKRYLVNSSMLPDLKTNGDGSLTIYIQMDSPGKDKESNWLPSPDGPFYVVMRLYWPKVEALNGTWQPPALRVEK